MALGWVDEEVDCLVGSDCAPCFGDLGPEFVGLGGAVGLVHVEPAGVDGGEEVEAEVRLAAGGEGEGFDDGGSETLPQEGGDACADAGGVDDYSAASPHVFENVNEGGEDLCVGLTRPPVVFDQTDGWELRPEAVVVETEFTDGDDCGVARGLNGPGPANGGLFRFAGEVYAGDVNAPGTGGVVPAVVALEEGLPGGVEEPSIVGNGGKAVLREEEGMIAAEALLFGLDVALVVGVVLGYGLPVELEVALDAVGALELEVGLLDLLEEGAVMPGGAIVDGGDVGGCAHRDEVAVEFIGETSWDSSISRRRLAVLPRTLPEGWALRNS